MIVPMLSIFAAVAIVFFVAERIDPARFQKVFRKGVFTDLLYCVSSVGIRTAMTGTLAVGFTEMGRRFLPDYAIGVLRDQPVWIQAVSIILVFDLIFYVLHRAKHHWRWLWRLHETHHSSAELDWFSSVRFHPLEKLFDRSIYLFPLLFLGVSEPALLILAAFDATIASFSHANLNWRIGPLIYVFVGPEMHRWHHSSDPRRQRCNFGNNLSIFDWIFGTAFVSRENPVSFGLGNPRFPEGNFVRQFFYAFRPFPRRRSLGRPKESAPPLMPDSCPSRDEALTARQAAPALGSEVGHGQTISGSTVSDAALGRF
jgi:sterol desaturase/sphingolipid hydroxylase (fatty acid hydroxylase superfamily)